MRRHAVALLSVLVSNQVPKSGASFLFEPTWSCRVCGNHTARWHAKTQSGRYSGNSEGESGSMIFRKVVQLQMLVIDRLMAISFDVTRQHAFQLKLCRAPCCARSRQNQVCSWSWTRIPLSVQDVTTRKNFVSSNRN